MSTFFICFNVFVCLDINAADISILSIFSEEQIGILLVIFTWILFSGFPGATGSPGSSGLPGPLGATGSTGSPGSVGASGGLGATGKSVM